MNSTAKQIARQRIQILFQEATLAREADPQLAQNYIGIARKIAMAARIRLPTAYKRRICRNCNCLLVPGESSRVRIRSKREPHIVVTCLSCGTQTRIPLRVKSKEIKEIDQNNY